MGDLLRSLAERRPTTGDPELPVTAKVVDVTDDGPMVVPLEQDLRYPIGPCYDGAGVDVGDLVLLVYTQDRPWVAAKLGG